MALWLPPWSLLWILHTGARWAHCCRDKSQRVGGWVWLGNSYPPRQLRDMSWNRLSALQNVPESAGELYETSGTTMHGSLAFMTMCFCAYALERWDATISRSEIELLRGYGIEAETRGMIILASHINIALNAKSKNTSGNWLESRTRKPSLVNRGNWILWHAFNIVSDGRFQACFLLSKLSGQ